LGEIPQLDVTVCGGGEGVEAGIVDADATEGGVRGSKGREGGKSKVKGKGKAVG
jgi:hypothetical protein